MGKQSNGLNPLEGLDKGTHSLHYLHGCTYVKAHTRKLQAKFRVRVQTLPERVHHSMLNVCG